MLRYKRHYFMAKGIHSGPVKAEFLQHAAEEQEHADRIAERIVQLGGSPNFSPDELLSRSHSEYVEGTTLRDMIEEDLVAERIAIESYREMAAYFAPFDTTTRQMIEEIQAVEEEHADDLAELLDQFAEFHDALRPRPVRRAHRACPDRRDGATRRSDMSRSIERRTLGGLVTFGVGAAVLGAARSSLAAPTSDQTELVRKANVTLDEARHDPQFGNANDLFRTAQRRDGGAEPR